MKRQRGFSLIEVIVAFALLAVALTLLLGSLSGAARQVRQADDYSRAALHAQSLLAQVGVDQPLQAGQHEGQWEQGRYRWRLELAPFSEPRAPTTAPPALMHLTLQVRWGDKATPQLQWRSLRRLPPATLEPAP
ncbi:prepilin-type N-terminal cleavage/methylation domain-containing protein [Stenotrophomonas sp. YIM B06876]|uniref:type II secretion system protein XpsI n=1 Tax=Stenotrophomonas sp. YIM B06876 TaxID=3060211 RepID=UPI002739686E|nr:prepilin-type N-terminal cleavage/methylation domain-containing protein [Stenotrophomonas sp. YIM B06876]